MKRTITWILIAFLFGVLAGAPNAVGTAAGYGMEFSVHPGTASDGGGAVLTSGWHYTGTGPGLDWIPGMSAYLRGYGLTGNSSSNKSYFLPYATTSRGNCTLTRVDIYNVTAEGPAEFAGTVNLTHIEKASAFVAGYLNHAIGGAWNSHLAGTMVTSENAGCNFKGAHLHQQLDVVSMFGVGGIGGWLRNTQYPEDTAQTLCKSPSYCGTFPNNLTTNFVGKLVW